MTETIAERKLRLNLAALEMRIDGLSFREIGLRLGGVRAERARQRVYSGIWHMKHPDLKGHRLHEPAKQLYAEFLMRCDRREEGVARVLMAARKAKDDKFGAEWNHRILRAAYPEDYVGPPQDQPFFGRA